MIVLSNNWTILILILILQAVPMQSKQLNINDFRYGLDSRRSELTSRSGVLIKCENAHITQGGEVQKRMAFVETQLPMGAFAGLPTSNGIMCFGSQSLSDLLEPQVPVGLVNGVFVLGNGTGYVTASAPVPGDKVVVGSTILFAGTGLILDGNTYTVTQAFYNVGGNGYDKYIFNVVGSLNSAYTGTFQLTNGSTSMPPPFQYQQLFDPNVPLAIYGITKAQPVSGNSFTLVGWQVNSSFFPGNASIGWVGVNPFTIGSQIEITGTGNVSLDGNTFTVLSTTSAGGNSSVNFYVAGASNGSGSGGTVQSPITQTTLTVAGAVATTFVAGSIFTISGVVVAPSLNGTWTAVSVTYNAGPNTTTIVINTPIVNTYTGTIGNLTITSANGTAMIALQSACLFNGLPFVVAIFTSGPGIYYNGQLVSDYFNGEVFSNANSNQNLAVQLASYVNATPGYEATVSGAVVTVTSVNSTDPTKMTPGGNFLATVLNTTAAGTLAVSPISTSVKAVIGESATASFTIVAVDATNGGGLAHVYVNDTTGTDVDLLGSASPVTVAAGGTPTTLATAVALAINTQAKIAGVTAQSNAGTVTVTMPAGASTNDGLLQIVANTHASGTAGGCCIDNGYLIINGGTAGSISYTTSQLKVNGVAVLSSTVTQASTTLVFAKALVLNINSFSATSLCCAALGPTVGNSCYVYLSRVTTQSGIAPVNILSTPTGSGTVTQALTNPAFQAKLSVSSVSSSTTGVTVVGAIPTTSVTAKPMGGVGPFTYQWTYFSGSNEVAILSPQKPTTAFEANIITLGPVTATSNNGTSPYKYIAHTITAKFTCTITDTGNSNIVAVTPPVTVTAAYMTAVTAPALP